MIARGLTQAAGGMPTAALAEEILGVGARAPTSMGGNPTVAWPDQNLSVRGLLVQFDVRMTPTAQLADYVLALRMGIEVPTAAWASEKIEPYSGNYGMPEPFGMYMPRLVDPHTGSDLVEEWDLMYAMAQRMGCN